MRETLPERVIGRFLIDMGLPDAPDPAAFYGHDTISVNDRAEVVMGRRSELALGIPIDLPCEIGFHCPGCEYPLTAGAVFDERLHWSEYNAFLWCEVCNRDFPSALCLVGDIDHAIEVFLGSVEAAIKRRPAPSKEPDR